MGRFISPDPLLCGATNAVPLTSIKLNPQSLNAFVYVSNLPMNLRDPLGLSPECNYYDKRCAEETGPLTRWYYCSAAKGVCEATPRAPWSNCVRQCLQDFDRDKCVPTFGRKNPLGLTALCAEIPGHIVCINQCTPMAEGPIPGP